MAGVFLLSAPVIFAQEVSPTPQTAERSGITIEEVIVTGSNIPTSEEVGPNPVDTYRREDITRLGARTATDLIQKLPAATGATNNENVAAGDGRVEINLRGILPKETLVLQDGRRLAPVGFAGDAVDLNTIPLGLIDHVDILKDGASAVYGSDAVSGVFNVWLIHKFRGLEIYTSYGNTNLGFANDAGEERGYLLAGRGDDKTDIVVYAEFYSRAAIYSRDADISSNVDSGGLAAETAVAFSSPGMSKTLFTSRALTGDRALRRRTMRPALRAIINICHSAPVTVSISRSSLQQSPRLIVNISMVRSIAKFATNTLSFLLTSNLPALSGTPPWRRLRSLLMYGRMQPIPF